MNRAWFCSGSVTSLIALGIRAGGRASAASAGAGGQSRQGVRPNEDITVEGRSKQRQAAFTTLERPWGSRCTGEGRKAFISGLTEYYYHRQNQTERYPETYGSCGADYMRGNGRLATTSASTA